ncbi:MAG: HIT domain-containing protein [Alphaproteobacteria bacterium]|nr:HIT domain-containing protein [Alphaproteobacteria bacterium]
MFELHPRLAADTAYVVDWPLCRVLLMNDARYRWLVLVPRIADAIEIHDLSVSDRRLLIEEIARASEVLKRLTGAKKINTGALGNVVPQLHVHVLARNEGDPAWPGPVWGHSPAVAYEDSTRDAFIAQIVNAR